jgi:HK97 gp10 family phage protein
VSVREAKAGIERKLARGLNARAEALRAEIFNLVEQSSPTRSGIQYPDLPNRSSAPGEPPAYQSGRLAESIAVLSRATPAELVSTVGPRPQAFTSRAPYPVFLEFGTRRMKPRPFMRPAVAAFRQKIKGAIARWPGGES